MIDIAGFVKLDFYRFVMIFGSVIFMFFLFVPEYFKLELELRKIDRQIQIDGIVTQIDLNEMHNKLNEVDDWMEIDSLKGRTISDEDRRTLMDKLRNSLKDRTDRFAATEDRVRALKASQEADGFIRNRLERFNSICLIGVAIGFSLFLFGLVRWYTVQVMLDKKLKAEIEEHS